MSSFIRRIERQTNPSQKCHRNKDGIYANPPREKFYLGRGRNLGVHNPKDKALIARLAREAKRLLGRA